MVRYSTDCKLLFVDTTSSDPWVVEILSQIQPGNGTISQPQLERYSYSEVCMLVSTCFLRHVEEVTKVVFVVMCFHCST